MKPCAVQDAAALYERRGPQSGAASTACARCMTLLRCAALILFASSAHAATHHVAINSTNPVPPFLTWETAATNIQDAIDVSGYNDIVLVSNGVYATGSRPTPGGELRNRVTITNRMFLLSVNGPDVTVIQGQGPIGTNAVRCAYLDHSAKMIGFTLSGGHTFAGSAHPLPGMGNFPSETTAGGGVYAKGSYVYLNNCIITGNGAGADGGGGYGGTYSDCLFISNSAAYGAGVSFFLTQGDVTRCKFFGNAATTMGGAIFAENTTELVFLRSCLIVGNSAPSGGGISALMQLGGGCSAQGCTIVSNTASTNTGGVAGVSIQNSIVYFNSAPTNENSHLATVSYTCTTPLQPGPGNISNNPQFVNVEAGSFSLKAASPCIDRGRNTYDLFLGTNDLDGNPRIMYGTVDMGAYEAQFPVGYWAWADAITNGMTNLTDSAAGDGYANLLKYAAGGSPTNADGLAALTAGMTNGLFALRMNRNTNAGDVTLIVEGSDSATNGAAWTGIATNFIGSWGGATNVIESGTGTPVNVTVLDAKPQGGVAANRFLRLRVSRP